MGYTDEELKKLEQLRKDLIIWMFNNPHSSEPIERILKEAFKLGRKIK